MFAVIKTGGKQYKVAQGDKIRVEKLPIDAEKTVTFDEVLLVAEDDGSTMRLGAPLVAGAKVTGTVLKQGRAKKIEVVKSKAKVRYHKKTGHRQAFTEVKIEEIS